MEKFYILLILFYLVNQIINYVTFPLKVLDEYNLNKIENFLLFNSTYTTIEMGTPTQKVNFYFNISHNKMYVTDVGCKNINLYNFSIYSSTLNVIGDPSLEISALFFESLFLYDNINLSKTMELEEFPLLLLSDFSDDLSEKGLCGDIGLSIIQYEKYDSEPEEFEYYLQYLRAFNKYFSFFNYNETDLFITNIFLHEEFKDLFKDVKNISWVNPILRNNILRWEINMKDIFYKKKHFKDKSIIEINPLFELIIGINDYKNSIQNDFFNTYIKNKKCLINEINNYTIFECDAFNFNLEDIKKFPTLYMNNSDIEHAFEMVGEELFYKLNNKYYFKIIFPKEDLENNKWLMGKIFLRKYPVIFSPANRLIGFYIEPNGGVHFEEEEETKDSGSNFYIYLVIILVAIIFLVIGLIIGKNIFFQRKRKANELNDDNYEYNATPIIN